MSVLPGMEDLRPAKVVGWLPSSGHLVALCQTDDGLMPTEFEMFINASGKLMAKKYVPDTTHDQTPLTEEQKQERVANRWEGVDQA